MNVEILKQTDVRGIAATSARVLTNYFEVLGANDDDLLAEAYRVRYDVFCAEREILNPAEFPDRQEVDRYDANSIHVLARHRSGATAGAARLVLHSHIGFPCQSRCSFDDSFAYLRNPLSAQLACYSEVSRLAVSQAFRRRVRDTFYGGDPRGDEDRFSDAHDLYPAIAMPRKGPEILNGILKYLYHESKRLGVTHWLIVVESGLYILLRRAGWPFVPVGPEVDYHGPVRPFLAEITLAERTLAQKNPELYAFLSEGVPSCIERPLWGRKVEAV